MMPKVGDSAPDFKLPDQNGKVRTLKEFKGQSVLVYFYPKDFTSGCTTEACTIRDSFPNFKTQDLVVLGISADTVESHKKFADKYKLPFTLLADPDKKVINLYGVWQKKKFLGKEYMGIARSSFLLDKKGKIAKVYNKVKPPIHAAQVLKDSEELK
ncbi:MAG TPA: thioredoxin-dependent thiol peroxidase [Candidatus Saccharimonadales bacterium]|nr:thioredoxin-dependent thiol peroxidase [Candidatus Saccharimonadales bacterium]